jgi:hypothetical protein
MLVYTITIMPFAKRCIEDEGKTIVVKPFHAYGWSRKPEIGGAVDCEPIPFKLRIVRFIVSREMTVALEGKVEEPGHEYDGYWVIAVPRMDDTTIDFGSAAGPCGLVISRDRSFFDASAFPPNHPEAVRCSSEPTLRGHGILQRAGG